MKAGLRTLVPLLLAAAAACGAPERAGEDSAAAGDTVGMPMPEGMQGMEGMQSGAVQEMRAHLQQMQGVSGARLEAAIPGHRQRVANVIAQFNREMRDMNMTNDRAWNATVDSLRGDLVRLPEMKGAELEAFMPEHRRRVEKLMAMHGAMMGT